MIPADPRGGNREGKKDAKNAGEEDLRRTVYVARAGHGRAPTRVEVDPRRGIARAAVATAEGVVDIVASASVWSPPGVVGASASPCVRVSVAPAIAAVNLSNVTVALEAAGSGTPRDLAPGAGPACVFRSPGGGGERGVTISEEGARGSRRRVRRRRRRGRRSNEVDVDDDAWDMDVRLSARCAEMRWLDESAASSESSPQSTVDAMIRESCCALVPGAASASVAPATPSRPKQAF